MDFIVMAGLLASFAMPLFNIPLIFRMIQRKSSQDISLAWAIGVWVCILLMTPAALISKDLVLKVFGVTNLFFFTGVALTALRYRLPRK